MRARPRIALPAKSAAYLARKQAEVDSGAIGRVEEIWKAARRTQAVKEAVAVLEQMCAGNVRCTWCEHDQQGSSIDHVVPKSADSTRMFDWNNWVLSCPGCQNVKGVQPTEVLNPAAPGYAFEHHFDINTDNGKFLPRDPVATDTIATLELNVPAPGVRARRSTPLDIERYWALKRYCRDLKAVKSALDVGDTQTVEELLQDLERQPYPSVLRFLLTLANNEANNAEFPDILLLLEAHPSLRGRLP